MKPAHEYVSQLGSIEEAGIADLIRMVEAVQTDALSEGLRRMQEAAKDCSLSFCYKPKTARYDKPACDCHTAIEAVDPKKLKGA